MQHREASASRRIRLVALGAATVGVLGGATVIISRPDPPLTHTVFLLELVGGLVSGGLVFGAAWLLGIAVRYEARSRRGK